MKIKIFRLLLQLNILWFLSGCNLINGILNHEKTPEVFEDNPFGSVDFPLESCSDSLPTDEGAYPLDIYTVFVFSSNISSQQIPESYCQQIDEGAIHLPEDDIDAVGFGSFIGRKRAEQFKEILGRDFEKIEISEPLTITAPDSLLNFLELPKNLKTPEEIADAALLNSVQLNTLLEIDRSTAVIISGSDRGKKYEIKVALPTYIPKDFELEIFDVRYGYDGNEYELLYRNPNNNYCFIFRGGFIDSIGSPVTLGTVIRSNSPAFGLIDIKALSSDKLNSQVSVIAFSDVFDFGYYDFYSTPHIGEFCQVMNFVEAVKVVESFQFLQPQ